MLIIKPFSVHMFIWSITSIGGRGTVPIAEHRELSIFFFEWCWVFFLNLRYDRLSVRIKDVWNSRCEKRKKKMNRRSCGAENYHMIIIIHRYVRLGYYFII